MSLCTNCGGDGACEDDCYEYRRLPEEAEPFKTVGGFAWQLTGEMCTCGCQCLLACLVVNAQICPISTSDIPDSHREVARALYADYGIEIR